MSDILTIQNLELWTRIGVLEGERESEQRILVSVECSLNTKSAAKSDDVKKSINYYDVSESVKALAKTERKTIERLAEDIAEMIQKKYKPKSVTVTVKKFAIPNAREVAITIARP